MCGCVVCVCVVESTTALLLQRIILYNSNRARGDHGVCVCVCVFFLHKLMGCVFFCAKQRTRVIPGESCSSCVAAFFFRVPIYLYTTNQRLYSL